jgi:hypothetical protein
MRRALGNSHGRSYVAQPGGRIMSNAQEHMGVIAQKAPFACRPGAIDHHVRYLLVGLYYKINNEIRRYENDETVSPGRSLLAVALGIFLIVPPSSPSTTHRFTSYGWSNVRGFSRNCLRLSTSCYSW